MDFFMYYDMGLNLTKESWFFTNTRKTNTYNVNTVHDTVSLCIYFTLKKKRGVSPCYVEQQQQQQLLVLYTHTRYYSHLIVNFLERGIQKNRFSPKYRT